MHTNWFHKIIKEGFIKSIIGNYHKNITFSGSPGKFYIYSYFYHGDDAVARIRKAPAVSSPVGFYWSPKHQAIMEMRQSREGVLNGYVRVFHSIF